MTTENKGRVSQLHPGFKNRPYWQSYRKKETYDLDGWLKKHIVILPTDLAPDRSPQPRSCHSHTTAQGSFGRCGRKLQLSMIEAATDPGACCDQQGRKLLIGVETACGGGTKWRQRDALGTTDHRECSNDKSGRLAH